MKQKRSYSFDEELHEVAGISVLIRRKKVKSLRIRVVPPEGHVVVTAPLFLSNAQVEAFVASRFEWICVQQNRIQNAPLSKIYSATPRERKEWLDVVKPCTQALIEQWAPILGVEVEKLSFRPMKSRWGSCTPKTKRICINTCLALYPPECLEYVVVHELCHLLVPNHGRDFKELMDRVMPDWKNRAAKLNN